MDLLALLGVIGLLGTVFENAPMRYAVESFAKGVLAFTEFSYDRTCAASSETRWVAPLKDRKELKVSNILIAEFQSFPDIQFSIGQCQ
jgi:hypothetical protein